MFDVAAINVLILCEIIEDQENPDVSEEQLEVITTSDEEEKRKIDERKEEGL